MSSSINDIADTVCEELHGTIQSLTINLIRELLTKWNEMYELGEDEKKKRLQKLTDYLKDFYNEILQNEEEKRVEFLDKIDNKLKHCYQLQKDLGIEEVGEVNIRTPYCAFLRDIDKMMARFLEQKEKRLEKANKIRCEELELCRELGVSPLPPFPNPIPTEQQLDSLQLKLFELHEEKINRLRTYKNSKIIIINLNSLLERIAATEFEKDIYTNSEDDFRPSTENMKRLENLKNNLQHTHDETVKRRQYLIEKLAKLWDRLKVIAEDREAFLSLNNSISKTHMAAIEAEIDRCEQIKRQNMKQVIESAREQISVLWDKLTYTQEQRLQFLPCLTDHFTEDVLELHELEIERLEKFYLTHQHIYELAERRNSLWERMLHFDELAQDKNRLFSNRGGQLLKEEKERKDLELNLPKVDKQLKSALTELNQPFLWHGKDLLEKITEDWEDRQLTKVSHKITRKVLNNKPLGAEGITPMGSRSATKQKRLALTPSEGGGYAKVRRCDFMNSAATTPKVDYNCMGISRSLEHLVAGGHSGNGSSVERSPHTNGISQDAAERQHFIPFDLLSVPRRDREVSYEGSLERSQQYSRSCTLLTYASNPTSSNACLQQENAPDHPSPCHLPQKASD